MRQRDMTLVNPSQEWFDKAAKALQAVNSGEQLPKKLASVWSDLKPELAKLSAGKCWYCESRQERSDNAVDHFRPKSAYPWYAFAYVNYRFACSFCNSPHRHPTSGVTQGKSNAFPLFEDSKQATKEEELSDEQPILLDPCDAADVGLLDFYGNGMPCPRYPNDPMVVRRVTESIRLYNLDHPELVEQRRVLALRLEEWIKVADKLGRELNKGNQAVQQAYRTLVNNIAQAMHDRAELSAFARRVVRRRSVDKPWLEDLLVAV